MIAVGIIVLMMLLTVADVAGRYFFNYTIAGTAELTEYMMVCGTFPALAWCALKGFNIKMELVVSRFPQRGQAIMETINCLLVLGICVLLSSQAFVQAIVAKRLQLASDITDIPTFPFYWVVTFGFGLLFVAMTVLFARSLAKVLKK